jgi:hypothetical protein
LINNRQNGRRRGRGGGGPRTPNTGGASPGNRQENRSRGNAAQLLEKYKSLARDAQLSGDRVQSEYFLQFAEHYFRLLNENRARFEEQRRPRDDYYGDDEDGEDDNVSASGDEDEGDDRDDRGQRYEPRDRQDRYAERSERQDRQERQDRPERQDRQERAERPERNDRPERSAERPERAERQDRGFRAERAPREERNGAPRDERNGERPRRERQPRAAAPVAEVTPLPIEANDDRIALEVLPPAIAAEGEPAAKPRRRTRRPREEGEAEIAPAA